MYKMIIFVPNDLKHSDKFNVAKEKNMPPAFVN